MHDNRDDNRDDYGPIIADRRSREPLREDTQPLWRLVLALGAGVVVVAFVAWWFMSRSSSDGASTTAESEISAPDIFPEEEIEQEPAPPTRDIQTSSDAAQAPVLPAPVTEPTAGAEQAVTPENIPEVAPDDPLPAPVQREPVSVRFMSPDAQVQIELSGSVDSSPPLTSKAGDVITVAPGTYRVIASGAELEPFEQEITFEDERSYEYTIELCAQRKLERESLAGQVVEERACATTPQCESMFMVLTEYADQLIKDRAFRTQQCAKWRPNAAPEGRWTLDTKCDGATLATTCRIEIGEGACTFAEPQRSVRGAACPRAELR